MDAVAGRAGGASVVPRSRYVAFAAIALIGCAADLATKHWIFARLGPPGGNTLWLVDDIFGFQTSINHGALFGMGQGHVWVFAALAVVAVFGILYWLFVVSAADGLLKWRRRSWGGFWEPSRPAGTVLAPWQQGRRDSASRWILFATRQV
jgi:hypothetical protein